MTELRIGVVGDYNPRSPYHLSTTAAIEHAAAALGVEVNVDWIPTPRLDADDFVDVLSPLAGIFAAPGSPDRSFEGALRAIRFARERGRPFLGT